MSKLRENRKDFINLTINEIILLILFLLLLLTAKLMKEKDKLSIENAALSEIFSKYDINEVRMMELIKIDEVISELKDGSGEFADTEIPDIFNKLVLAKDKYKKIKDKDTQIAKLADELKLTKENLKEIEKNLNESKKKNTELEDETGVGWPPCWPKKDDPNPMNADYLYDAYITLDGIKLKNTNKKYPARKQQRLELPLSNIEEDRPLSKKEFENQTKKIYEWAKSNKCHHFLYVYDYIETDKRHYKEMIKAIGSRFYFYEDQTTNRKY